MCNRKKIVNWIRLCKRMQSLARNADLYRAKRTAWVYFCRWFKYMEAEKLNGTPGLVPILRRRCELHPGYNENLREKGFEESVYCNSQRLVRESADVSALFYRWQMFIQESMVFDLMKAKATRLYELRLMQRVLYSMRYSLPPNETLELRQSGKGFPITRIQSDLDQISKRFVALRRLGLASVISSYNRRFMAFQVSEARSSLSFKKFLTSFKQTVAHRLTTEQRVLSEAFDSRGFQDFSDIRQTDVKLPHAMTRLDGRHFSDPVITSEGDTIMGIHIPAGYRLSRLRLNMLENAGIVGWQLAWYADCAKEIESPRRGHWHGAGMTVHEISIPLDDFVQGLEYLYEGSSIMGIRLKLWKGGWTKQVGRKSSMSTLSIYLSVDHAGRAQLEDDYEPPTHPSAP